MEKYGSYQEVLAPWCEEHEQRESLEEEISEESMRLALDTMQESLDNLDMDTIQAVIDRLLRYQFAEQQKQLLEQLREAAADFDAETCDKLIDEWKKRENW